MCQNPNPSFPCLCCCLIGALKPEISKLFHLSHFVQLQPTASHGWRMLIKTRTKTNWTFSGPFQVKIDFLSVISSPLCDWCRSLSPTRGPLSLPLTWPSALVPVSKKMAIMLCQTFPYRIELPGPPKEEFANESSWSMLTLKGQTLKSLNLRRSILADHQSRVWHYLPFH